MNLLTPLFGLHAVRRFILPFATARARRSSSRRPSSIAAFYTWSSRGRTLPTCSPASPRISGTGPSGATIAGSSTQAIGATIARRTTYPGARSSQASLPPTRYCGACHAADLACSNCKVKPSNRPSDLSFAPPGWQPGSEMGSTGRAICRSPHQDGSPAPRWYRSRTSLRNPTPPPPSPPSPLSPNCRRGPKRRVSSASASRSGDVVVKRTTRGRIPWHGVDAERKKLE